jgi:hypothetical protein
MAASGVAKCGLGETGSVGDGVAETVADGEADCSGVGEVAAADVATGAVEAAALGAAALVAAADGVTGADVCGVVVLGAALVELVGAAAEVPPEPEVVDVWAPQPEMASARVAIRPSATVREPYIQFPQVDVCQEQRRSSWRRYTSQCVPRPWRHHL